MTETAFHVILPDRKEVIFRLYFVDTPEDQPLGLAAMEFRLKVDYENIKLRFT
jgi:hypothetical protein